MEKRLEKIESELLEAAKLMKKMVEANAKTQTVIEKLQYEVGGLKNRVDRIEGV